MGTTFAWICKLWTIVWEMIQGGFLFKHKILPPDAVYKTLLAWSDSLPRTVRVSDDCPHHVVIAQCDPPSLSLLRLGLLTRWSASGSIQ